ncbi:MAG: methionine--tRNA ligase [Candidatus Campbellbacteria bacterium]|nr:methionine--tRNA ligase [Candidatus Campbellbacteria bacterium]
MSEKANTRYVTTTLPYVNADPHLGHALEFVQADCFVRHSRLSGYETFFNIGTDEHGLKVLRKAEENDLEPQEYVDQYAERFRSFADELNIDYTNFIRTTDSYHKHAAREFWKKAKEGGFIYKKHYRVKYCVGCELEKTDSELVNGRCPVHPNMEIELIDEENYFFTFSRFAEDLIKLYEERPDFVLPDYRLNEIKLFTERGLNDFSISRLKEKMPWGVEVPDDEEHVMYVWFDALVNYISTLGWPDEEETFNSFWPVIQFAGKDNLRQQSAMWQAMLMAAGIEPSKQVVIHGFILNDGEKMSKSLGNVIDPLDLVNSFSAEALRYYLLRHVHPFEDSSMSVESFGESYNGNLTNGLGNLVSRILKMYIQYEVEVSLETVEDIYLSEESKEFRELLDAYEFNRAMDYLWREMSELDEIIQEEEPFKLIKTDPDKAKETVAYLAIRLGDIAALLTVAMPETGKRIRELLEEREMPEPLFPRK